MVTATSPRLSTSWWQLTIEVLPKQEDVVYWRLEEFGCQGMAVVQGEGKILAYVPVQRASWLDLAALSLRLRQDALIAGMPCPDLRWELLESEDWANSWKQYWQPQEVGDRLLICPAWTTPPVSNRLVIRMDPGMAFGTGTHPTTQLCLEALEMRLDGTQGQVVADVGCGSGVLSLAAVKLGAAKVYAVDTDPLAVEATLENRQLNQMREQIWVKQGSLEHIPDMVDGLVCNILAETILDMIPAFRLVVKEKGWMILSGILLDQAKIATEMLEAHDWMVSALWKRGEWCCLNVRASG
ncbi:MAG: 50S ribosomal protein L11 methyltransferase [Thermostichales cyanobacterium SZTDM-1c_bins_54]